MNSHELYRQLMQYPRTASRRISSIKRKLNNLTRSIESNDILTAPSAVLLSFRLMGVLLRFRLMPLAFFRSSEANNY